MKFGTLAQDNAKDDNGNSIVIKDFDIILAPYRLIFDGFYEWQCADCGKAHSNRSCGWRIYGQVLTCDSCKRKNLLVRTDFDFMDELFKELSDLRQKKEEMKKVTEDGEKEIKRALASRLQPLSSSLKNLLEDIRKIKE